MTSLFFVITVYFTGGMIRGAALTSITPISLEMYHRYKPTTELTPVILSFGCAMIMFGSALSGLFAVQMANKWGRKCTMVLSGGLLFIANVLTLFPVHLFYYMAMKFIVGICSALIMQNVPLVLSEQVEPNRRGVVGSLMNVFIAIGVFVGYAIQLWVHSYFDDSLIWAIQIFGIVFGLAFFVCSFFIKDTGLQQHGVDLLKADTGVKTEVQKPVSASPETKPPKPSIKDRRFRKCYLLAIGLGLQMPATAQNSIMLFASHMFQKLFDTPLSGCIGQCLIAAFQAIAACLGLVFVRFIKRRTLFSVGLNINVVAVACYLTFSLVKLGEQTEQLLFILTVGVALFVSQLTTAPLTLTMASEIFPTEYKSKFMNMMIFSMQIGFITTQFVFPIIPKWISYVASLSFMLFCDFVLVMYLPETFGRTLQEIQDQLIRRKSMLSKDTGLKSDAATAVKMADAFQVQTANVPEDGLLE